jgi:post-segregation antitoxin (ccd killing protein)
MKVMSERLNISVQDDLYARLQTVKESINVSAVCANALESEIRLQEAIRKAQSDRQKRVAELRREREQAEDEWIQLGREEGLDALKDTTYSQYLAVEKAQSECGQFWFQALVDNDEFEFLREIEQDLGVPATHQDNFREAFFLTLFDEWLEIKDEVMQPDSPTPEYPA